MSAQDRLSPTPGQTVGPFFGYALPYDGDRELVPQSPPHAIRLHGRVYDGAGDPVPDALIELWQAGARRRGPARAGVAAPRRPHLHRLGPGRDRPHRALPVLDAACRVATRAPFFALTVFARGLLDRLFTRAYLPGSAPQALASLEAEADDRGFVFDIRLQGADETVFLSYAQD